MWCVPGAVGGSEDYLVRQLLGIPSNDFDITVCAPQGFTAAHPDAYAPLFAGSPAEQPAVSPNITRYVNTIVTKAFTDARTTRDVTRQVDDYRIIQEQLFVDVPMVFIVQTRQVIATSRSVRDLTKWSSGSGATGLGQDEATISLAQIWKS